MKRIALLSERSQMRNDVSLLAHRYFRWNTEAARDEDNNHLSCESRMTDASLVFFYSFAGWK